MLEKLKNSLRDNASEEFISESIAKSSKADTVKNTFLNDFEMDVVGAENDPVIEKLIDGIPEYDDNDEDVEAEVEAKAEAALESAIETVI